ncbi:MAG: exodeoxyribonuclease V subunit beta, partial [Actinomycetes bacterium]
APAASVEPAEAAGPAGSPPPGPAISGAVPELLLPSPMRLLPSGPGFGTAVHAVYESVDPRAPDLPGEVARAVRAAVPPGSDVGVGADTLAEALYPSWVTPLGPLADGRRLCDIGTEDRLPELAFELPLAGGEHPSATVRLGLVASLLRTHVPDDDLLAGYADRLDHPALAGQVLRGYLNGSIDAVLRIRGEAGNPRYLVVDYKTNWLGGFPESGGEPVLTLGDYTPRRMAGAMMAAHYPLQALLYSVAVHRYLRWRQPDYDPDRHLGGILYLFVRGMAGPQTPVVDGLPCGVFGWRPSGSLVCGLSDLLERGA